MVARQKWIGAFILFSVVFLFSGSAFAIKPYEVYEISLSSSSTPPSNDYYHDGNKFRAVFEGTSGAAKGKKFVIWGFWYGYDEEGNENLTRYLVRFAPPVEGYWQYTVKELNNAGTEVVKEEAAFGDFLVSLDSSVVHGFLEEEGDAWRYSDGYPFISVGDSQWSFSEEVLNGNESADWESWMHARSLQGFNTFLGTVWLAKFPETYPGQPEKAFLGYDFTPFMSPKYCLGRPVVSSNRLHKGFLRKLDQMIQYANNEGIIVGLAIGGFPDSSCWFNMFNSTEENDRWFKYIVRRYAAYNVRWVMYGEIDKARSNYAPLTSLLPPPEGINWVQQVIDSAKIVRNQDPYHHPIGSHHTPFPVPNPDDSDINVFVESNNITYLEVQAGNNEDQYSDVDYRGELKALERTMPISFEEYWNEPPEYQEDSDFDHNVGRGTRNTYKNFIMLKAFPTMGSLMRSHIYETYKPNGANANPFSLLDWDNLWEDDPGALRLRDFANLFVKSASSDLNSPYSGIDPFGILVNSDVNQDLVKRPNGARDVLCGKFKVVRPPTGVIPKTEVSSYAIYVPGGNAFNINLTNREGRKFVVKKMRLDGLGGIRTYPQITATSPLWNTIETGESTDCIVLVLDREVYRDISKPPKPDFIVDPNHADCPSLGTSISFTFTNGKNDEQGYVRRYDVYRKNPEEDVFYWVGTTFPHWDGNDVFISSFSDTAPPGLNSYKIKSVNSKELKSDDFSDPSIIDVPSCNSAEEMPEP